jgi:hypothetical protein
MLWVVEPRVAGGGFLLLPQQTGQDAVDNVLVSG